MLTYPKLQLLFIFLLISTSQAFNFSSFSKLSSLYSSITQSLREEIEGAYHGLNLLFHFDKEAYDQQIRYRSPNQRFMDEIHEDGFDTYQQWVDYQTQKDGTERRNLDQSAIKRFEENFDFEEGPCNEKATFTQYQYFCSGVRVRFEDYIQYRLKPEFECEPEPRIVKNRGCYHNYSKCGRIENRKCSGAPNSACEIILQSPSVDCFDEEYMEKYGYGETCKVLDSNEIQNVTFYLNCTMGIHPHSHSWNINLYETVTDYEIDSVDDWWFKDHENFIFLPWDPEIVVKLRIQDFKYLSDHHTTDIKITDPLQLIAKKPIEAELNISAIPKTAKPGGRMFYQFQIWSTASYTREHHQSGFFALKDYEEPQKSYFDAYYKMITLQRVTWVLVLAGVCSVCYILKRRKRKQEEEIYNEE